MGIAPEEIAYRFLRCHKLIVDGLERASSLSDEERFGSCLILINREIVRHAILIVKDHGNVHAHRYYNTGFVESQARCIEIERNGSGGVGG